MFDPRPGLPDQSAAHLAFGPPGGDSRPFAPSAPLWARPNQATPLASATGALLAFGASVAGVGSIQDDVQLVVMQRLRDWGLVDIDTVREQGPKADSRDLLRALQILLADGLIERSSPLTSARLERIAASQGGIFVTNAGVRWLAHAE